MPEVGPRSSKQSFSLLNHSKCASRVLYATGVILLAYLLSVAIALPFFAEGGALARLRVRVFMQVEPRESEQEGLGNATTQTTGDDNGSHDQLETVMHNASLPDSPEPESQAASSAIAIEAPAPTPRCRSYDVGVMLHERYFINSFWGSGTQIRWIQQAQDDMLARGCSDPIVRSCNVIPTIPLKETSSDREAAAILTMAGLRETLPRDRSCLATASLVAAGHANRAERKTLQEAYDRSKRMGTALYRIHVPEPTKAPRVSRSGLQQYIASPCHTRAPINGSDPDGGLDRPVGGSKAGAGGGAGGGAGALRGAQCISPPPSPSSSPSTSPSPSAANKSECRTPLEPLIAVQLTEGALKQARGTMKAYADIMTGKAKIANLKDAGPPSHGGVCPWKPQPAAELSGSRDAAVMLPPACEAWTRMRDELRRKFGQVIPAVVKGNRSSQGTQRILRGVTAVLLRSSRSPSASSLDGTRPAPQDAVETGIDRLVIGTIEGKSMDLLAWALRVWASIAVIERRRQREGRLTLAGERRPERFEEQSSKEQGSKEHVDRGQPGKSEPKTRRLLRSSSSSSSSSSRQSSGDLDRFTASGGTVGPVGSNLVIEPTTGSTSSSSVSSTPSVTPSVSSTPLVTPSVSSTPSVTPSVSSTPSVTPSASPTPSHFPTPLPPPAPIDLESCLSYQSTVRVLDEQKEEGRFQDKVLDRGLWRLNACAALVVAQPMYRYGSNAQAPQGSDAHDLLGTASAALARMLVLLHGARSGGGAAGGSRAALSVGKGAEANDGVVYPPGDFQPHLRELRSMSLVSNCVSARDKVLIQLGRGGLAMAHIGKCPLKHSKPPFDASEAAGLASGRSSNDWFVSKLRSTQAVRHLFAFENFGVSFTESAVQRGVAQMESEGYVSEKALDAVAGGAVPLFHGAETYLNDMLPAPVSILGEVWLREKANPGRFMTRVLRQDPRPGSGIASGGGRGRHPLDLGGTAGFVTRYAGWRLGHLELQGRQAGGGAGLAQNAQTARCESAAVGEQTHDTVTSSPEDEDSTMQRAVDYVGLCSLFGEGAAEEDCVDIVWRLEAALQHAHNLIRPSPSPSPTLAPVLSTSIDAGHATHIGAAVATPPPLAGSATHVGLQNRTGSNNVDWFALDLDEGLDASEAGSLLRGLGSLGKVSGAVEDAIQSDGMRCRRRRLAVACSQSRFCAVCQLAAKQQHRLNEEGWRTGLD